MFDDLTPPYGTICVDPPWSYDVTQRLGGKNRRRANARARYSTLTRGDLLRLPVSELADDAAHLWLWVTNARLVAGDHVQLIREWGFRPITVVTWCKDVQPGLGKYVRNTTEHLVLAVKGWGSVPDVPARSTWHVWPRGQHSVKPAAAFDLIESVSPGPYVELFARQQRLGWSSWGLGHESASPRVGGGTERSSA